MNPLSDKNKGQDDKGKDGKGKNLKRHSDKSVKDTSGSDDSDLELDESKKARVEKPGSSGVTGTTKILPPSFDLAAKGINPTMLQSITSRSTNLFNQVLEEESRNKSFTFNSPSTSSSTVTTLIKLPRDHNCQLIEKYYPKKRKSTRTMETGDQITNRAIHLSIRMRSGSLGVNKFESLSLILRKLPTLNDKYMEDCIKQVVNYIERFAVEEEELRHNVLLYKKDKTKNVYLMTFNALIIESRHSISWFKGFYKSFTFKDNFSSKGNISIMMSMANSNVIDTPDLILGESDHDALCEYDG